MSYSIISVIRVSIKRENIAKQTPLLTMCVASIFKMCERHILKMHRPSVHLSVQTNTG